MQDGKENGVQSLDWEDPLEEDTTTYFRILAWRIPWSQDTVHGVSKSWTPLKELSMHAPPRGGASEPLDAQGLFPDSHFFLPACACSGLCPFCPKFPGIGFIEVSTWKSFSQITVILTQRIASVSHECCCLTSSLIHKKLTYFWWSKFSFLILTETPILT